jgi:hypothetical protein
MTTTRIVGDGRQMYAVPTILGGPDRTPPPGTLSTEEQCFDLEGV